MDKNIERILQSPMMKIANENQARLDSLSLASGYTEKLLKITQDLDPAKRWAGRIATQDLLSQFSQDFPQSNLGVDKSIAGIIKSLAESNSINKSLFESTKLNTALIDAFEATHLGLKPPTQFIFPEGAFPQKQFGDISTIMSKATEAFRQLESLSNLESFKAISRLKNFPNDKIWTQDYDKGYEVTEDFLTEVKTIDAKISDEISSVDDFNDLSEETQNSLKQVFSEHYEYFIMKIIVSLSLLQENLNKDLDLSNKSFIFVNSLEGSIFFIGSYWNQNKSAIINGLITTAIYNAFIWLFFMK